MWLVPASDLSPDQVEAVGLGLDRNRVIIGGPGSGKTLVLAHRGVELVRAHGLSREQVHLLVFTNVLQDYIAAGLADLGLADLCSTFDSWCRAELKAFGLQVNTLGRPENRTKANRDRLHDHLTRHPEAKRWAALLVDEGQDLDVQSLEILRMSARHVTLAMDERQQLYDTGTDVGVACGALGVRRQSASLLTAFRCTPNIVQVAAEFLDDPVERERFRRSNLMQVDQRETPVLRTFGSYEHEAAALAKELQNRAFLGQSSAVLLTSKKAVARMAAKLADHGLVVHTRTDPQDDLSVPKVLTYHSAKGLTVDAVFLPQLSDKAFRWVRAGDAPSDGPDLAKRRRMLFVAVSRASQWLWMSRVALDPNAALPPLIAPVEPLVARGVMTRGASEERPAAGPRAGRGSVSSPVAAPAAPTADADDDDLFDLFG